MSSANPQQTILVTGAAGQVGGAVCAALRAASRPVLGADIDAGLVQEIVACDLRDRDDLARLLRKHDFGAVIHTAGFLPSAFQRAPLDAAEVNLGGSLALLRLAAEARVSRFVFASSMSVYGAQPRERALSEEAPSAPDDPYGAAKLAVELVGDALRRQSGFPFLSLRIARVLGPGIRQSSSPWREQIFTASRGMAPICIPFAPEALLSVVHVRELARMLVLLADKPAPKHSVYNTPAEICTAGELKSAVEELRGVTVELASEPNHAGPTCDGSRFEREFGFQLRGFRNFLADSVRGG